MLTFRKSEFAIFEGGWGQQTPKDRSQGVVVRGGDLSCGFGVQVHLWTWQMCEPSTIEEQFSKLFDENGSHSVVRYRLGDHEAKLGAAAITACSGVGVQGGTEIDRWWQDGEEAFLAQNVQSATAWIGRSDSLARVLARLALSTPHCGVKSRPRSVSALAATPPVTSIPISARRNRTERRQSGSTKHPLDCSSCDACASSFGAWEIGSRAGP